MNKKYFSLETSGTNATINIYGDITSWPWMDGDVSAVNLSKQLDEMTGVDNIDVYINSYGGEVAEGLAIYNSLKRHPAQVTTYVDGFACSIASVIFMAGDKRVMNEASLLMIHNAWSWGQGNAAELRKLAKDLDTITNASVAAYMSKVSISEEDLRTLMDAETWLEPSKALAYGFASSVEKDESNKPSQNAKSKAFEMLLKAFQAEEDEDEEDEGENPETDDVPETDEQPETDEDPEDEEPQEAEGEEEPEDENDEDDPVDADGEDEEDEDEEDAMQFVFFRAIQHM